MSFDSIGGPNIDVRINNSNKYVYGGIINQNNVRIEDAKFIITKDTILDVLPENPTNLDFHAHLFYLIEKKKNIQYILERITYNEFILYYERDSRDVIRDYLLTNKFLMDRRPWVNFIMQSGTDATLIKYLLVNTYEDLSCCPEFYTNIERCLQYGKLDLELSEYSNMIIQLDDLELVPLFRKYGYKLNTSFDMKRDCNFTQKCYFNIESLSNKVNTLDKYYRLCKFLQKL